MQWNSGSAITRERMRSGSMFATVEIPSEKRRSGSARCWTLLPGESTRHTGDAGRRHYADNLRPGSGDRTTPCHQSSLTTGHCGADEADHHHSDNLRIGSDRQTACRQSSLVTGHCGADEADHHHSDSLCIGSDRQTTCRQSSLVTGRCTAAAHPLTRRLTLILRVLPLQSSYLRRMAAAVVKQGSHGRGDPPGLHILQIFCPRVTTWRRHLQRQPATDRSRCKGRP
jgi:hypothetical protein